MTLYPNPQYLKGEHKILRINTPTFVIFFKRKLYFIVTVLVLMWEKYPLNKSTLKMGVGRAVNCLTIRAFLSYFPFLLVFFFADV